VASRDTKLNIVIDAQNKATSGLRSVSTDLNTMNRRADALAGTFSVLKAATAAAAASIGFAGFNIVKAGAQFEQTQVAFETMLGTAEQATKTLDELSQFAASTPFELGQLEEASKRLLAYGTTADNLIPTLKMLGDITAGVGMEKLPQLILAFGQVQAATKLTGAELRQFAEAGVPLLGTLASQLGKTEAEIIDMVSDGAIGFEDMKKALESLTSEGGKFQDLMLKQSTTLGGQWSNLKDQISLTARALGTELLPFVKPVMQELINLASRFREALAGGQVVSTLVEMRDRFASFFAMLEEKTMLVWHIKGAFDAVRDTFQNQLKPALDELMMALAPLKPFGEALAIVFGALLLTALHTVVAAISTAIQGMTMLLTIMTRVATFISETLLFVIDQLSNLIQITSALLRGDFVGAWDLLKERLVEVYEWFTKVLDVVRDIGAEIKEFGGGVARKAFSGLTNLLPGRAAGGPVMSGSPYMVGEKGPEMFVPKTSGTIIPNNRLWQGSQTIINITGNTLLSDDAAEEIGDRIMSRLKLSAAI
jgi:tape measure domain-containing protein